MKGDTSSLYWNQPESNKLFFIRCLSLRVEQEIGVGGGGTINHVIDGASVTWASASGNGRRILC